MPAPLSGHAWTIAAALLGPLRSPPPSGEVPWALQIPDPAIGTVRLSGYLCPAASPDLVVIVHGLGGTADSPYVRHAARVAAARGCATVRINMRGASGDGEDVYHAGLASDLAAVIDAPSLRRYANVFVVGYSLGGHLTLRLALQPPARLRAVAAVGSPLDLAASCRVIDRHRAWPYRSWILRALRDAYRSVDARGRGRTDLREVAAVRRLRQWDARVIVARHDFADVDDYYARASVGPRLPQIGVPATYVGCRGDPMVPPRAVVDALEASSHPVHVRWLRRGGHVGYPDTAYGGRPVEDALLDWFDNPSRPPGAVS